MAEERFSRTEMLIGDTAVETLRKKRVIVFGVGGVGGYVCEALARSGIGTFGLVDPDSVAESNINRQIVAGCRTVGRPKTEVMKERILDISPDTKVRTWPLFFLPACADEIPFAEYDYVVDAVDTVTAKIEIICRAMAAGVPVISAMGAGNRLDPSKVRTADLADTKGDGLARVMRRELRKRGIEHVKVVYSEEEAVHPEERRGGVASVDPASAGPASGDPACVGPISGGNGMDAASEETPKTERRRSTPGSMVFVPAASGILLASEVVRDLLQE
ncbi:MAG: tRNA threonylcarbamoyladenosine dehydratase [Lachnospiraceae bacterium]|nr:tRNA threonylcarbamoyladenosine dehydratase [Lachnospiraceae bacterium]